MTAPELTATSGKGYCNVLARQKGLDPAGHAGHFEDLVVLETPLPWKRRMYDEAGTLPQQLLDLHDIWLEAYHAGLGYPHRALMVASDEAYSRDGFRRVMFYKYPHPQPLSLRARGERSAEGDDSHSLSNVPAALVGAFARYEKVEYLVPTDEVGALIWAWHQQRDDLPRFDVWRDPGSDSTRDLLVCTHGTVDAACAKFGYPLYKLLRDDYADDSLRVWRVSHFGGHVFAPTLVDMPTGHYWAFVEPPQADQIARRDADVRELRGHYRGWSGFESSFLQAAERELWQRFGWAWLDCPRAGRIEAKDEANEEAQWADVRIDYTAPDGVEGSYMARVEIGIPVETRYSTSETETYPYEQYRVTDFTSE